MRNIIFTFIFISLTIQSALGQKEKTDSLDYITFFSADYAYHIPKYDMAKWFNNSSTIGASFGIKNAKNWTFGANINYLWGESVKNQNSVLRGITNSDGNIIDGNGQFAIINYSESGWTGSVNIGKVIPLSSRNQNSGLWIRGGIGFLQHKILIQNPKNLAPQIKDDYKKGYDLLSNGFSCNQFIGYLWLSKRSAINAYVGFEFVEGWTKLRRTIDFNTGLPDNSQKFDLLMGIKIGAIIPVFKRRPDTYYFN